MGEYGGVSLLLQPPMLGTQGLSGVHPEFAEIREQGREGKLLPERGGRLPVVQPLSGRARGAHLTVTR